MPSEVSVSWGEAAIYRFDLEEQPPMTHEAARAWLDQQFVSLDCEPLRASGKVLTADKILVVTQAAGAALFADAKWSAEFVAAVSAALGKPMIRVRVPSMTITY